MLVLVTCVFAVTGPALTITVTNTNDSGPGSLRNALSIANDGDTIDATGVSGSIFLTSGELQIHHNVTINGPGAANLAVNGNATSRVFENFGSNVAISGFMITNGDASGIFPGGGILNHGGLTLSDSSIVSNTTATKGGGIYSTGGVTTVTNSTISNNVSNQVDGYGGGIFLSGGGTVTVTNSTISNNVSNQGGGIAILGTGMEGLTVTNSVISGNQTHSGGGGISAEGATVTVSNSSINGNMGQCNGGGIWTNMTQLTVTSSTISSNSSPSGGQCPSGMGGGIWTNMTQLTVTNSTISGNSVANGGGGMFNQSGDTLTIKDSTFSGNSAGGGGCILIGSGEAAHIGNTILNAGSGGTILGGTFTSLGYNLASDNGGGVLTGPGDQINTDPLLGPLQDNGGPTFTQALLPGSPAINAGDPNFTPPPSYDQRGPGFDRVVNGRIDIGSFEVQEATPTPTPTPTATSTPTATASATATATATSTPTSTPIATPTATATPTPTPTPTPRATPTPRVGPTPRVRPTPVPR